MPFLSCPPPPVIRCQEAVEPTAAPLNCRLGDDTTVLVTVTREPYGLLAVAKLPNGTRVGFDPQSEPGSLSPYLKETLHVPICPDS